MCNSCRVADKCQRPTKHSTILYWHTTHSWYRPPFLPHTHAAQSILLPLPPILHALLHLFLSLSLSKKPLHTDTHQAPLSSPRASLFLSPPPDWQFHMPSGNHEDVCLKLKASSGCHGNRLCRHAECQDGGDEYCKDLRSAQLLQTVVAKSGHGGWAKQGDVGTHDYIMMMISILAIIISILVVNASLLNNACCKM